MNAPRLAAGIFTSRNIAAELERGIRDATKRSEQREPEKVAGNLSERNILRKMEIAGFEVKDEKWFFAEVIADTAFKGYGDHGNGFYAYVGKIDDQDDLRTYLDDLDIVIYRTENKVASMKAESEAKKAQVVSLEKMLPDKEPRKYEHQRISMKLNESKSKILEITHRIEMLKLIYLAFFIMSEQDMGDFLDAGKKKLEPYPRFKITCSSGGKIHFGDVCVDYSETQR